MKALTIWQPWATLIMIGAKPWEWRGWATPKWIVGQRIVIHAGARPTRYSEIVELRYCVQHGDTSLIADIAGPFLERIGVLPLAAGLGTAVIGKPIPAAEWAAVHDKEGLDLDRIDHSKFAWPLTDIQPFASPIPCKGAQGFWNWPEAGQEPR